MRLLVLTFAAALLAGCHPAKNDDFPAGVDCPAACERLRTLECLPDGAKSPAGKPCEEWYCKSDLLTAARASCVSHAADCDVVRTTCREAK
jgi:hypothetical protein